MQTVTDTLSECSTLTATHQSPEGLVVAERNPKKHKRRRDHSDPSLSSPIVNSRQDMQAEAELLFPDSTQWRTPSDTPVHASSHSVVPDSLAVEDNLEDADMEDDRSVPSNPVIPISEEEKERIRRPWRRSLIIRILGRKVGYSYLLQRLQKMWKPEACFDLITLDHEYYIVRFESQRDYDFAKFEGPWSVLDHYVVVQEWVPNFCPKKNKTKKLLAWVRFPTLPVEYFDEQFLMKIAKRVGRPIKIDTTTSLISKCSFAWVCVEIDISKPLLSKFTLEEEVWPVEYEGLHLVCFQCGLYGHKENQCGPGTAQNEHDQTVNNDIREQGLPEQRNDYSANYGPWMLVTRKDRRGPRRVIIEQLPVDNRPGEERVVIVGVTNHAMYQGTEGEEHPIKGHQSSPIIQNLDVPLPRIRTDRRKGKNPVNYPQNQALPAQNEIGQNQPQSYTGPLRRGAFRGSGGRGGTPRRAAAETEHPVVRVSNQGRHITSTIVYHIGNQHEFPTLQENEVSPRNDPPDIPSTSAPQIDHHVDAMISDGPDGPVDPTTTKSWLLSVVYGSPNAHLRKKLFADLTSDSHHPDIPWLVVGDFNSVLSSDETSSPENFSLNRSSDFKNWIFREGLIDLGFTGSKFTWKRGIDTPSFKGARLDRALGNIAWKISFPNSLVEHLPMINSDHSPILVNSKSVSQAPSTKSFRFNLAWSTHPSFIDCVKQAWSKWGNLESNKTAMAKSLAAWNKGTFGNIFHKKKKLLARINGVQRSLAIRPRADLIKLGRKLRTELEDVLYQEELLWFQRSREEWIESGDRNTHFYHTATATKTNSASLKHIKDENGQHLTSDTQIRDHIFNFFVNSFSENCPFVSSNLQSSHFTAQSFFSAIIVHTSTATPPSPLTQSHLHLLTLPMSKWQK
ncbi:PREDICTED: uncharacterized protein LOC109167542 [Ipomoea nil]|uniref:uncharacterized protein LOC109167542 n=1 Tax=Ipomoea nil TaxID=35883 RepID=UPI0009016BFA|nr:PREDICTED: uncharacterized protein LOC109167542 [Ipomoea nil]